MPEAAKTTEGGKKVVWISTRKAVPAADKISANLIGRYILHETLQNGEVLLQEFSAADVVMFEIPPVVKPLFEHHLLEVVQRIRSTGPEVLIIVQPSLRRMSNNDSLGAHVEPL